MVINETLATPVLGEYDAVVVGAGPAGCGAAIALGRSGLKTLLIEKFNCLGGAWTTGFMNPFFDYEQKTGIVEELVSELKAKGQFGGFWGKSFHYEYMKLFLERKMKDANVEVLYNTTFSRTLVDEKRYTALSRKTLAEDLPFWQNILWMQPVTAMLPQARDARLNLVWTVTTESVRR